MKLEFHLYAKPPLPEVVGPARALREKQLPLVLVAFIASVVLGAVTYIRYWDKHPEWQFAFECGLIVLGLLIIFLVWKLVKIILCLIQLGEAHPETARAYLACASNEAVKSYSRTVMQQGRNLTMGEADMLMEHCKTREEILKLAAYYEKHAPLAIYE